MKKATLAKAFWLIGLMLALGSQGMSVAYAQDSKKAQKDKTLHDDFWALIEAPQQENASRPDKKTDKAKDNNWIDTYFYTFAKPHSEGIRPKQIELQKALKNLKKQTAALQKKIKAMSDQMVKIHAKSRAQDYDYLVENSKKQMKGYKWLVEEAEKMGDQQDIILKACQYLPTAELARTVFPIMPFPTISSTISTPFVGSYTVSLSIPTAETKLDQKCQSLANDCQRLAKIHKQQKTKVTKEAVQKVRLELVRTLRELFTLREERRKKRVVKMENELGKLKKELKIRDDNREKIIERRLKQMIGEKDPLEW